MFNPKLTITNKINNLMLEIEKVDGFLWAAKTKSGLRLRNLGLQQFLKTPRTAWRIDLDLLIGLIFKLSELDKVR